MWEVRGHSAAQSGLYEGCGHTKGGENLRKEDSNSDGE